MKQFIEKSLKPGAINESRAAEYIGVSASTLAEWRKDGIGPKYVSIVRPNSTKARILYPIKFLDEWLDKSAVITA